jgi:hypothetical protein
MTRYFKATDATGRIHTRSSDSRVYSPPSHQSLLDMVQPPRPRSEAGR